MRPRDASATAIDYLTSTSNPRVRAAAALRERRERDRTGLTLVDGIGEIQRALAAGVVETLFVHDAVADRPAVDHVVATARTLGVSIALLSTAAHGRLAFGSRDDGLVAVVRPRIQVLRDLHLSPAPLVIVTEDVEKPGNLGAIVRTADGAGVDAVIAAARGTDLHNPNAIRASLGTVFSMPLAAASAPEVLAWLREGEVRIVTCRLDAAQAPWEVDLRGPVAIVLGSESAGLSAAWDLPDAVGVRVPMLGSADSLNVAATAAILAYEARRQRGVG